MEIHNGDSADNNPGESGLNGPTDTFIISNKQVRRAMETIASDDLIPNREIILVIRGMSERLVMKEGLTVVLGRADLKSGYRPDVDLTPYGAQNRGVSRSHARLYVEDEQLYVIDLGSPNGTFVSGDRLPSNEPRLMRKGDNLMLGSLVIQVHY
jgi:pSer/pThr/pTyr-binding forkhead associated (FHA) protein